MEILRTDVVKIFRAAVNAVLPHTLIERNLRLSGSSLNVANKLNITVNKNVHVVGAGKATLGMTIAVEKILFHEIQGGFVSIPAGSQRICKNKTYKESKDILKNSKIKIMEGAVNNMPDENSLKAANAIKNYIQGLTENDLLLVLISGGASALLPSPIPPVTLADKKRVTELLVSKGATIQELNSVRKHLSQLKGGGLARLAFPAQVVSLIISDVIGDPLEYIGSGPTIPHVETADSALAVLNRYKLTSQVPESVLIVLRSKQKREIPINPSNILIGSNCLAVDAAKNMAEELGYVAISITNQLDGEARKAGEFLAFLSFIICKFLQFSTYDWKNEFNNHEYSNKIAAEKINQLNCALERAKSTKNPICILCGGETTVDLGNANGIGGRNQELILSTNIHLERIFAQSTLSNKFDVIILSAGTDGIDGPTDAAGAMTDLHQKATAMKENLDPQQYLSTHDSYTFYQRLCNGQYSIRTGHTGTNVMDVQIILIKSRDET